MNQEKYQYLLLLEKLVLNLLKVKGRFHTEQAYEKLKEFVDASNRKD